MLKREAINDDKPRPSIGASIEDLFADQDNDDAVGPRSIKIPKRKT
jgi:hypothetical protein